MKHIVREVPAEQSDFSFYFDDDGLTGAGGDYCNTLFIVARSHGSSGFNEREYKEVQSKAEAIIDSFNDVTNKWTNGYSGYETHKEAMQYNNIPYTSRRCHLLKAWAREADTGDTDDIAEFLAITTGKEWKTDSARGYCQGDYVEMVYCPDCYKQGVKNYGETWLGAAKEFYTIDIDEDGEEGDTCYGFIVADCQARQEEDYKRLVCEWAGLPEEETRLEMIDESRTYTKHTYRAI